MTTPGVVVCAAMGAEQVSTSDNKKGQGKRIGSTLVR